MPDSPRYCMFCETWGDHHTDRCPIEPDRDAKLADAERKTQAAYERATKGKAVPDA